MPIAQADIRTENAAAYLTRLCGHVTKMRMAAHRMRRHSGAMPLIQRVDTAPDEATLTLDRGQCSLRVLPGQLSVRAEAADQASLQDIQDLISRRLETLGARERLTVDWRRG